MGYPDNCGICGESYDNDNLMVCSGCGREVCYKCGSMGRCTRCGPAGASVAQPVAGGPPVAAPPEAPPVSAAVAPGSELAQLWWRAVASLQRGKP